MARQYAKIKLSIWKDDDYRALGPMEQWLYEALVSQPDLSLCGLIILRPHRWARLAAGLTAETVDGLLTNLEESRYLCIDRDSEEVLIRTFVKHDGGTGNWKVRKGIESAIEKVESDRLRAIVQAQMDELGDSEAPPIGDAIGDAIGDRLPIDAQSDSQSDAQSDAQSHQLPTATATATVNQQLPTLPPAAAAAVEILIQHRVSTEVGIRNISRYSEKMYADTMVLLADRLIERDRRGDTAREIAVNVLGLTTYQASLAETQLRQQQQRAADPDCEHCHGEGIAENSEGRFDTCECRGLASVHELRRDLA
jgi:hypothetical protein